MASRNALSGQVGMYTATNELPATQWGSSGPGTMLHDDVLHAWCICAIHLKFPKKDSMKKFLPLFCVLLLSMPQVSIIVQTDHLAW